MLLGNYTQLSKCPIFFAGGDSTVGQANLRFNFNQPGDSKSSFYGENWKQGTADRFGVPAGYSAPYAWNIPTKTGGMGSSVGAIGTSTMTGSGALGMNIESTIAGLGEISSANLGLILSAVATIAGIGGLSADVVGALNASATLAGEGSFYRFTWCFSWCSRNLNRIW